MKKCLIEDCNNKVKTKGFCGQHYYRLNKYGDPLATPITTSKKNKKKLSYAETHRIIDGVENKLCRECEKFYPMNEEYFYKKKTIKDGFDSYCKACTKKRTDEWRLNNPERWNEIQVEQYYNNHDKWLAYKKERSQAQEYKDNYKKWQRNNPDKIKQYNIYRQMNKIHNISEIEWNSCKEYFNNSCAYCGMNENEHKEVYKQQLHKEHVEHDGSNDLSNCIPACKPCNGSKHQRDLSVWYNESNPNFSIERLNKIYNWLDNDYEKFLENKLIHN